MIFVEEQHHTLLLCLEVEEGFARCLYCCPSLIMWCDTISSHSMVQKDQRCDTTSSDSMVQKHQR